MSIAALFTHWGDPLEPSPAHQAWLHGREISTITSIPGSATMYKLEFTDGGEEVQSGAREVELTAKGTP